MKSRIVATKRKELSVDDVEISDTISLAAGNNDISVTYLGKEYTSTITAKQKQLLSSPPRPIRQN